MKLGSRQPGVATVVLGVVLGLLAAGCGSGSSPDQPTLLRVMMTDDWVTPPFVSAVREFESEHPGVRVEVDKAPISHMIDTVRAAVRSGTVPDVVQAHAFAAASQGLAQPVDDLWAQSLDTSEFLPGAVDDVTWAGRLYGVPLDTNALFIIYNNKEMERAGVAVPAGGWTFEQFEAVAKAVSTPDGSRRALAIPTSTWWTYAWIKAAGGELMKVDPDGRVQLSLDSPAVVNGLDYLARLVRANLAFPPRAADSHSGDALALFRAGSAAMLASGSWDLPISGRDPSAGDYQSTLMPAGGPGGGTVMGGSSMFVPTGSRNRRLAFEFMTHLISDPYALRLAKEEGRLPVRVRLYQDQFFKRPELKAVIEQLPTASPFKLDAFPEAHDAFAEAVDEVLREGGDAATVMAAAQQRAQALIPPGP